jgi:hypothetical protein
MAECDGTERTITVGPRHIRTPAGEAITAIVEWIFKEIAKDMAKNNIKCDGDCPKGEGECGLELVKKPPGTGRYGIDKNGNECEIFDFPGGDVIYKCGCAENDRPAAPGGPAADDGTAATACDETKRSLTVGKKRIRAVGEDEGRAAIRAWLLGEVAKEMKAKGIKCNGTCADGECGVELLTTDFASSVWAKDKHGQLCVICSYRGPTTVEYKCSCAESP